MLQFDAKTAAILERAYQGRDFVRRRAANVRALSPRPGEAIADIGCGTGLMLRELALAVGETGQVTGIEPSPDMRGKAERAVAELENARVMDGTADRLPLADGCLDGLTSLQVFEYIANQAPALAECRRVLKPGGRLVIGDMHFGTLAWAADDRDRMDRVIRSWDAHFADRRTPETLLGQFGAAGFRHEASIPVQFTDTAPAPDGLARMMQILMAGFAHQSGQVPRDEAEAWSADLDRMAAEGRYLFSLTHIITVARAV